MLCFECEISSMNTWCQLVVTWGKAVEPEEVELNDLSGH